ncbi:MAG: hypothetical protein ACT4OX_09500 [Actinomycetota bacterium]
MAGDARARDELRRRLDELLGAERADTLMEALPPMRWDELATKADIADLRHATKADIAHIRAELAGVEERTALRMEASEHRMMAAFRGEVNAAMSTQTRAMLFSTFGSIVGVGSLVLAAASLS